MSDLAISSAQGSRAVGSSSARRAGPHPAYTVGWIGLFVVALGYLGAVAFAPSYLPQKLSADIEGPRPSTTVALAPVTPTPAPAPPTPVAVIEPPAAPVAPPLPTVETTKPPTSTAPVVPNLINAPPKQVAAVPGAIETGALPPNAAQERRPYGIQIGNAPSLDTLRLVWSRLVERHRGLLTGSEPRFVASDGNAYVLIAGPFTSEAEARRICADFAARRDPCRIRDFAGDGLF
jgi:hypothetical protein